MNIRSAAKAIIIQDGKLLAIKCVSWKNETYYLLPGGGQNPGEPLTAALKRECLEEIGAEVDVGELLLVRDYIGLNHEFSDKHANEHQLELMFACTLKSPPRQGTNPDTAQVGIEWLPLDRLEEFLLFPRTLRGVLKNPAGAKIYLGDVN